MNIRTVYTDHSMMSLHTMEGIMINKVLQCYSCNLDAFICVSHANCINFLRRQNFAQKPDNVYIIPNAVDAKRFDGDFSSHPLVVNIQNIFPHHHSIQSNDENENENNINPSPRSITIVVLSRLVYRKGVVLLKEIIHRILSEFPQVQFLIGGSGDQDYFIREVATQWNEQAHQIRVAMMGEIGRDDVPAFLVSIYYYYLISFD